MIIKTKDGWKPLGKPIDFSKFEISEYVEQPMDDEQKRTLKKDLYGGDHVDEGGVSY